MKSSSPLLKTEPVIGVPTLFGGNVKSDAFYVWEKSNSLAGSPKERALLRRMQSLACRESAKCLLNLLGVTETEILTNPDRSPIWPEGVVGSIAHSDRCAFVAIARSNDLRGLGVDVESIISKGIYDEIKSVYLSGAEVSLVECNAGPAVAATICFSAKEAIFKCIYPLCGRYFDFKEVEVVNLDYTTQRIFIRLTSTLSGEFRSAFLLEGSFIYDSCSVFTAFELLP